jgi:hypothetical protein
MTNDELIFFNIDELLHTKFKGNRLGLDKPKIQHFYDTVKYLYLDELNDDELYELQLDIICNWKETIDPTTFRNSLKKVALLHDILEDTDTTIEELRAIGITDKEIELISLLTRSPDKPKDVYWKEIFRSPEALTIKLADRISNMNDILSWIKIDKNNRIMKKILDKYDTENISILSVVEISNENRYNIRKQISTITSLSKLINEYIKE